MEPWMDKELFEDLVLDSIKDLPEYFLRKMENVEIVVQDICSEAVISKSGMNVSRDSLLGLYQGVPLRKRRLWYCNVLPDKITLFRKPIERQCSTVKELKEKIREVIIHEIGHYFGLNEEEIQKASLEH